MSRIVANLSVSEMEPIGLEVNTQTDAQLNPAYGIRGEKGEKGDKGDKGDRGESGSQGEQGIPGVTPSFSIGTVSTLEPGSSATATITGTAEHPILNLGLPAGATGAAGQNGRDGSDGQDGQDGQDGYSPVRGTDYWTSADQQAVTDAAVAAVLAAYPAAEGVQF